MLNALIYFLAGGTMTTLIVLAEQSGQRLLAGLATLVPVFTLIAYLFIGETQGGVALSQNAKLVLVGTFVTWVPYMLVLIYVSPHLQTTKAVGLALLVFFLLAIPYLLVVQHFGWFQ